MMEYEKNSSNHVSLLPHNISRQSAESYAPRCAIPYPTLLHPTLPHPTPSHRTVPTRDLRETSLHEKHSRLSPDGPAHSPSCGNAQPAAQRHQRQKPTHAVAVAVAFAVAVVVVVVVAVAVEPAFDFTASAKKNGKGQRIPDMESELGLLFSVHAERRRDATHPVTRAPPRPCGKQARPRLQAPRPSERPPACIVPPAKRRRSNLFRTDR